MSTPRLGSCRSSATSEVSDIDIGAQRAESRHRLFRAHVRGRASTCGTSTGSRAPKTDWSPPTPLRSVNYASSVAGHVSIPGPRRDACQARPLPLPRASASAFFHRSGSAGGSSPPRPRSSSGSWRCSTGTASRNSWRSSASARRIAADLHDDIGASLSQIAILSELARGEADTRPGDRQHTRSHCHDLA